MKHRLVAAVVLAAITPAVLVPATATAHRSWCHSGHSCPSDHATYKWRGKLCVKPAAPERSSAFKKKVSYAGRTYYCK
jgi:hypothetical protein